MNSVISRFPIPIIGIIAPSGTGKTTLLEKVVKTLTENSFKVGIIKHAHHNFEPDIPGKDSYRLRKAGATQTIVSCAERWMMITENRLSTSEAGIVELLNQMDLKNLDIIICEGFKDEAYPKIILHRQGKPLLPEDSMTLAYATDDKTAIHSSKPILNLNDTNEIVNFIKNSIN